MAPFGLITDCNSPDFNGVDGILGFGKIVFPMIPVILVNFSCRTSEAWKRGGNAPAPHFVGLDGPGFKRFERG